ncbi:MAG: phage tail protein [Pyrinomonadaceae bacterium]
MANTVYGVGQSYLLDLDGQPAGKLRSSTTKVISDHSIEQSPKGQLMIDDIKISCGAGMDRVFQEWIRNTIDKSYTRKDGSVTLLDVSQKKAMYLDFNNALISELSTPALDRSAKGDGYFAIAIRPERLSIRGGQHSFDSKKLPKYGPPPRPVNTGRFKLAIDGLETECANVTKVDSLSFKLGITNDSAGQNRTPGLVPSGKLVESDLVLTIPAPSVGRFYDWFTSLVTQGSKSDNRNGSLEYLAADSDKRELRLEFGQLGIKSLGLPTKDDLKPNDPAKIALYYDSIKIAER